MKRLVTMEFNSKDDLTAVNTAKAITKIVIDSKVTKNTYAKPLDDSCGYRIVFVADSIKQGVNIANAIKRYAKQTYQTSVAVDYFEYSNIFELSDYLAALPMSTQNRTQCFLALCLPVLGLRKTIDEM